MSRNTPRSLDGRRVLITGPARGIGAQVARLAAQRGARLSLVGLEPDELRKLATELGGSHWAEADVTDQASLDASVTDAVGTLGGLDIVVANAGVASTGTVNSGDIEAQVRTVDVNLTGVLRTVKATLPHLIASNGYALLMSSAAAFSAMPGMGAYAASKAGVEQLGNVLRREVAHRGVAVGTVHPIWIDTDLTRDLGENLASFHAARRRLPWPLRDIVDVETCATAVVRAMEKRKRKVFVPRVVGAVQAMRVLSQSRVGDLVTYLGSGKGRLVDQFEAESKAAGRIAE